MTTNGDLSAEVLGQPSLWAQLRRRFEGQAGLPALHAPGSDRWLTYGELGRDVNRTAHALAAAGATPGGRVGVMLPNGHAFIRAWLALVGLNATMVPVNVNLVGAGLRHILVSADLDLLLVDAPLLTPVRDACGEVPPARRLLADFSAVPSSPREDEHPGCDDFATLLADAPDIVPPAVPVDPADPALIIYTSGTTGPPKGVVLSRTAQLWHGLNYLRAFIQLGPGETGYTPLPLFHVSAQGFSLGCLLGGASVAIDARFNPFAFWETLRRHHARAFNYVGAMIPLLYNRPPRPDDRDNPAERAVGSATLPELHEAFERRFGLRLIESYGQSEMAGLWLTDPDLEIGGVDTPPAPHVGGATPGIPTSSRRVGRVGKPRRWLEARILREDGSEAAPGEAGEIVIRPAHPLLMTQGYFRDPEATARAFPSGPEGWYHTGDVGDCDREGFFRFRGRLKDFIRRRGENISAFEIEREALTHPAVREAAAVGVPSPLGEDEVKLCVIPHEGQSLDPADLDRHLRPRLAAFMRPRYIDVRDEFPRTPTQRVQKYRLREEGVRQGAWDRKAHAKAQRRQGAKDQR